MLAYRLPAARHKLLEQDEGDDVFLYNMGGMRMMRIHCDSSAAKDSMRVMVCLQDS